MPMTYAKNPMPMISYDIFMIPMIPVIPFQPPPKKPTVAPGTGSPFLQLRGRPGGRRPQNAAAAGTDLAFCGG